MRETPTATEANERRTARYERRRRQVIDAAAAVFAEKGYEGAGTKDIADRLNIRQGSLYYYFASKEAALEEVCYWGIDDFIRNIEASAAAECPPEEKLRRAIFSHLRPLATIPDYIRVFTTLRQNLPRKSRLTIGQLTRRYEAHIEEIIRAGIRDGSFAADIDSRLAALGMIGFCNSVTTWYGKIDHPPLEKIMQQYADTFVAGLRRGRG